MFLLKGQFIGLQEVNKFWSANGEVEGLHYSQEGLLVLVGEEVEKHTSECRFLNASPVYLRFAEGTLYLTSELTILIIVLLIKLVF